MKVIVDYDVCASTGSCMQVCPEVFEVRSDGFLYVLQDEPPPELHEQGARGRASSARRGRSRSRVTDALMGFHDRLAKAWSSSGSMLCVGLDPDPASFPAPLDGAPDAIVRFCTAIVDATADLVCAFKPQIAHFASQRAEPQLEAVCAYIRERHPDVVLVLDAKRGDIGSTAEHYAREAFGRYGADAVTVNPYLGTDAATPFLEHGGVLALCRTSNAGQRRAAGPRRRRRPAVRAGRGDGRRAMVAASATAGSSSARRTPTQLADVRAHRRRPADPRARHRRPGRRPRGVGAAGVDRAGHRPDRQLVARDPLRLAAATTSPRRPAPSARRTEGRHPRRHLTASSVGAHRVSAARCPLVALGSATPAGRDADDPGGGAEGLERPGSSGDVGAISMTAVPAVLGPADVHVGDVHAGVAEQRADGADHARPVVVGDHQHVVGGRHVERVPVDEHDAVLAAPPGQRAATASDHRRRS